MQVASIKTRVSGIPCVAIATMLDEQYPPINLYDMKGYHADWLLRKMSSDNYFKIVDELKKVSEIK